MAARFRSAAELLASHEADEYRIAAYRRGAAFLDDLVEPVDEIYHQQGVAGLEALPSIGTSLASAIADVVETGHWHWYERLRGDGGTADVFTTVAGIGPELADRIHDQLGIETLTELEQAANDGRLATVDGFGSRRTAAVRDCLAGRRLRVEAERARHERSPAGVTAQEILSVDAEYRDKADRGLLPTVAPRRYNPTGASWLPVLHTTRADRHYTAMFSNTARAHQLARIQDWVVVFSDDPGDGHWTVITELAGPRRGERTVRGETIDQPSHGS